MMKIGMVGLSLSHPYTFAKVLAEYDINPNYVWDYDNEKTEDFAREFGGEIVEEPENMISKGVNGVFIDTKSGDHRRYAEPFLSAGIPTFIDKPMATKLEDLKAILDLARRKDALLMSNSVLRYAPSFRGIFKRIEAGELGILLSASAIVAHGITGYLQGFSTWQDNIEMGGGSIINMGIHGMEPLYMALGPGVESVHCISARRHHTTSQSEDTAIINVKFKNGALGVVQVLCGIPSHGYYLTVHGSERSIEAKSPSDAWQEFGGGGIGDIDSMVEYGYTNTVIQFLKMIGTRKRLIPLEEMEEIIKSLLAARISAAEGRVVSLEELS